MGRLTGKIAVVTGGSRGIGRAIVDTFVREGAEFVLSIGTKPAEIPHANVRHVAVNVVNFAELSPIIAGIKEEFGRIDILVNNAGVTKDALIQKMDEEMWDFVIDINLKGVFNLTKLIAPMMMEQGKGSIINLSSVVGEYGNVGQTNYAATKAGLFGMTKTWAKEFTRKGAAIRTNAIAPGYINTEMMATVPDKVLDPIRQQTPLGRLGEPQEIADAVLFLASDESTYINGHTLSVNGGLTL